MNRILIFTDWFAPGYKAGGPISSVKALVEKLRADVEINLVTRNTDYTEQKEYPSIVSNEWIDAYGIKIMYLSEKNQNISFYKTIVTQLNPDTVYLNSFFSFKFTILPLLIFKNKKVKILLATRGMLASGALSIKSWKKKVYIRIAKLLQLYRNVVFHATSVEEKNDIQNVFPQNRIFIAQNFPNSSYRSHMPKSKESAELNILYLGRIAAEKNVLYAIELLKELDLEVNFQIVGPIYNDSYYQQCMVLLSECHKLKYEYSGPIASENLDEVFDKNHVLLLPTLGENYGHVIIEALNHSCIPVISDRTPWNNLEQEQTGFVVDLDNRQRFISVLEKLFKMSNQEYNQMTARANAYAKSIIEDPKLKEDYLNELTSN